MRIRTGTWRYSRLRRLSPFRCSCAGPKAWAVGAKHVIGLFGRAGARTGVASELRQGACFLRGRAMPYCSIRLMSVRREMPSSFAASV